MAAQDLTGPTAKTTSAWDYIATPKDGTPYAASRALLVTVGGTLNVTSGAGNNRDDVPVVAGINPIATTAIRAGGTATGIFRVVD